MKTAVTERAEPYELVLSPERLADGNLTFEEGRALFEAEVEYHLGITGDEFLRRLDAGEYDAVYDDPGFRHIARLAMFGNFVR